MKFATPTNSPPGSQVKRRKPVSEMDPSFASIPEGWSAYVLLLCCSCARMPERSASGIVYCGNPRCDQRGRAYSVRVKVKAVDDGRMV
jgi:hypothetical protein